MALTLSGDIAGLGKVVQIVRATDSTQRTTTSTSFVDASLSVTITPQKSDSAIFLIANGIFLAESTISGTSLSGAIQITDSADNTVSGGSGGTHGLLNSTGSGSQHVGGSFLIIGYSTPATTLATTYKVRFKSSIGTTTMFLRNAQQPHQLLAIEVAA